jgi:putative copper export protein
LAAEPLALSGQTASLSASSMLDPVMVSGALDSSFGRVLALRLGAAMGLWVLLGIEKDGAPVAPLALATGVLLAFVDGASAHAAGMTPVWLGYTVNAVHLFAVGLWLGGIVSLVVLWRVDSLRDVRGTLLRRFSPLAASALLLVAVSGLLMAWAHQALPMIGVFGTYTIAALIKATLLLCAGAVAAIALRRTGVSREHWWVAEASVLALALVVAGVLVSLPPPT